MWAEWMWRPFPCKAFASAPVAQTQHLFAFFVCAVSVYALDSTACTARSRESTAVMTHTAINYTPLWPFHISTWWLYMAPNMCSNGGLSQLEKLNPIYYLWEDINSRDCDPLLLNGPLQPSIILSSIHGSGFTRRMGCNVIYVNNAYFRHTLLVTCLWSLINRLSRWWKGD